MKPQMRPRSPPHSSIVFSTEARGTAEFARSGYQTPAEIAEREETMRVVNTQPHRLAFVNGPATWVAQRRNEPLECALGRFCATPKPPLYPSGLGEHCYDAGVDYRRAVFELKRAIEIESGYAFEPGSTVGYVSATDEEKRIRRQNAERNVLAAESGIKKNVWLMRASEVIKALRRLCCEELDPLIGEERWLIAGLSALSIFYQTAPRCEIR